jgi:hypothetical protein
MLYVGETGRSIADRLNDHLSAIRTMKTTPIGLHFRLPGHDINDLQITGIEKMTSSRFVNYRKIKEQAWIVILGTSAPHGINASVFRR